jgi:hypothetical protein
MLSVCEGDNDEIPSDVQRELPLSTSLTVGWAASTDDASGISVGCSDNAGKLTLTLGTGLDFTGTFNQPTGIVHVI